MKNVLSVRKRNSHGPLRLQLELSMGIGNMRLMKRYPEITASKTELATFYLPPEPLIIHELIDQLEGGLEFSDEVQEWLDAFECDVLRSLTACEQEWDREIPDAVTLRDYQLQGAMWMYLVKRCILADDTGIGKTVQALLTATRLIEEKGFTRILVVCPRYVAFKWQLAIFHLFDYGAKACIYGNKSKRSKTLTQSLTVNYFTVVNYEMVDPKKYPQLFDQAFDCVIFDEAHYLQGRDSQRNKHSHALVNSPKKVVEYVLMLTASPIYNRLDASWALFNILMPNRFSAYWQFVHKYCVTQDTGFGEMVVGNNPHTVELVKWCFSPYILQRKKYEVEKDLPQVIEKVVAFKVSDQRKKEYKHIVRQLKENAPMRYDKDGNVVEGSFNLSLLRRYLIMREYITWKDYDVELLYDKPLPDEKFEALIGALKNHFNTKAIIFAFHKDVAEYYAMKLGEALSDVGVTFLHSKVPQKQRDAILEEFVSSDEKLILVGTIGTIGTGIDLQVADLSIFVEHEWLHQANQQAIGRTVRIGQKNNPVIVHLMSWGTIEQYIYEVCLDKEMDASEVLNMDNVRKKTLESLVD